MKRFLATLLAAMMTLSLVCITVRAEGEVVFTVPNIEGAPGETVDVSIMIDCGSNEMHVLNAYLQFDPALLSVNSITQGGALSGSFATTDFTSSPGEVKVGAMYAMAGFTGSDVLMTVNFTVDENASGAIPLTMVVTEIRNFPVGGTATDLPFTTIDGAIVTGAEPPTEAPTEAPTENPTGAPTEAPTEAPAEGGVTFEISPAYSQVHAGETFTVDVELSGEFEANMLNFQLNYDDSAIEFVSAQNGSVLDAAIDLSAAVVLDGETIPGSVRLGVLMPTEPLSEAGVVFSATFRARANASAGVYDLTPVVESFASAPLEGGNDSTPMTIENTATGAQVEILETETEPPATEIPTTEPPVTATPEPVVTPAPNSARFYVDPVHTVTEAGQEVSVAVKVTGNYETHAFTFKLDYDSANFEIVSAENGDVLNNASNIGGVILLDSETIPGSVRLGVLMPADPMSGEGTVFTLTLRAKSDAAIGVYPVDIETVDFVNYPAGGEEIQIEHEDVPGEIEIVETITEPPVTEPPVTEPPATEPPVTEPPVTEPPATEPPVTEPPATEIPITEPPTTEIPVNPGSVLVYVDPAHTEINHNDTFSVDVKISGEYAAHALTLQFNYDSEHFEIVNSSNGSVLNDALNLGASVVLDQSTLSGSIRLGVLMPQEAMSGEGSLFSVTFREKGNAQENVPYVLNPVVSEIVNYPIGGEQTSILHTDVPGDVTVTDSATLMQAAFYIDPAHTDVNAGDTFTVAVKVEGNFEAHGLNHQLNYNPDIFEFVSAEKAEVINHIEGLNGTAVIDGSTIPGSVRLGVLMPDEAFRMNGVLYNVTFRAKLSAGAGLYDLAMVVESFVNFPLNGDATGIANTVTPGEVEISAAIFDKPTFIVEANPDMLRPGDTFSVCVRIEGEYPEAHALNHQLNYNASCFDFVSYERGPVIDNIIDNGGSPLVDGNTIPGSIRFGAIMPDEGLTMQGIFYTATFRVKSSAPSGTYPFEQAVTEFSNFPLNGADTPIEHNIIDDEVEVVNENNPVIFRAIPDPTVLVPGQLFTVDATVENPYEAHGLNFKLDYDINYFEFVSCEMGQVLIDAANKGGTIVLDGNQIAGSVRLGVLMPNEAMNAEGVLFTATFRVAQNAPVGTYDFIPTATEFVNFPLVGDATPIEHNDILGQVEIVDTVTPTPVPTEPPVEPTEPPVEPTEPPVDPTQPPVEPTEPPVEPTPTTPPTPPTGTMAIYVVGIVVLLVGAGLILFGIFRKKEN